jgi:hypothetical protein
MGMGIRLMCIKVLDHNTNFLDTRLVCDDVLALKLGSQLTYKQQL